MAKSDFERYVASKGGSGADVTIDPVSGKVSVSGTGGHIAPYVSPSAVEAVENIWDRGDKYNGPGSTAAADGGVAVAGALAAVPNMNKPTGGGVAANAIGSVNPANPTPAAAPESGTGGVNGGVTSPGGSVNAGGNVGGAVTVPDTAPGGTVGGTAAGGAATAPAWEAPVLPAATDQSQYIRELYEAQQEAKLAAAERAYNQSMAAIEKQAATIPEYYYEAGRQTAGLNAREVQAMNERFNAAGLNTGASGQAALAQNAVYQGNMAAIRQAEANALAAVEADRASLAIDYQNQIREAILNNETEKAQALYAEMLRVDESIVDTAYKQAGLDLTAKEFQFGVDKYNQGRADEKAAAEEAKLEERAAALASIGDFSLYKYLGYTDDEIAKISAAWQTANAPKGGGGTYTPASNLTFSRAKELADSGYIDADVAAALMKGGYSAGALQALYGYTAPSQNPGAYEKNDFNSIGGGAAVGAAVTQLQASGESDEVIAAYIAAAVEQGLITPQDAIWLRNG